MKLNTTITFAASILLLACNSLEHNSHPTNVIETENSNNEEKSLVLNNGEKWIVVPEMMLFIRNMEKDVKEFSHKNDPSSESYQNLAFLIDKNIRLLTENCTMEGQAHDELHKWLIPFIGLSENFDVAENIDEQKNIYIKFEKAFFEFNTFFE